MAARFTTGTGVWELNSVELAARNYAATANFQVSLYSISGQVPGTKLADFTGPNPGAYGNYTYTAASEILLQPGTTYFIVASSTESESFYGWGQTNSSTFTTLPGWSLYKGNASTVDGVWGPNMDGVTPLFAVTATAVPEPSALVLAALGLGALGVYRFSRRSARVS